MSEAISDRSSVADAFRAARSQGRAALVLYTTAGFPRPEQGLEVLLALADAGADVIELGVPFSDPLADGPTIQKSSFDAISLGVDLPWTLDLLRRFRAERSTSVVVFSYLNPILRYGVERFAADAAAAGADGVLVTDLPAGADPEVERALTAGGLDLIRLIGPTTSVERMRRIATGATGFLYLISRTGVTGARQELSTELERRVALLRSVTDLPIAVGFGVSTPEQAEAVGAYADGVIVGSALVQALSSSSIEEVGEFARRLRAAM